MLTHRFELSNFAQNNHFYNKKSPTLLDSEYFKMLAVESLKQTVMKKTLYFWQSTLFLNFLVFLPFIGIASVETPSEKVAYENINTIFQTLAAYEKLEITTNLDSLILNKRSGKQQAALLRISGDKQKTRQIKIKIKARGRFRKRVCDLPPIRLNFSKKTLASMELHEAYDKLKLVTHCLEAANSEQALLKEYWTYCMYNQLTPNSFKVKLFEVTYIQADNPSRKIQSYAFIIENTKEMAHRLGGQLVDAYGMTTDQITPSSYHNALLFNYMIGNTDWHLAVQRNLKLVKLPEQTSLLLVPYDFDYAKLVDASYMPVEAYKGVVQLDNRHAKGYFSNKQALEKVIAQFKSLQKSGFRCYKTCDVLKKKEKARMDIFIKSFYRLLKDEERMADTFLASVD